MSRKFEDSEQLLKTERLKYEALRREKKASEDKTGGLLAEVDSLKRQLQDYARRVPSADKPAQAVVPSAPNVGKLYRVAGLYADDSLNLRSGPGASKPIVIQLKNGVELSVVGSAVKNGPDVWLPCVIENAGSSSLKGWVNSNFVEPVPAQ